jgi:hypothetical protein
MNVHFDVEAMTNGNQTTYSDFGVSLQGWSLLPEFPQAGQFLDNPTPIIKLYHCCLECCQHANLT